MTAAIPVVKDRISSENKGQLAEYIDCIQHVVRESPNVKFRKSKKKESLIKTSLGDAFRSWSFSEHDSKEGTRAPNSLARFIPSPAMQAEGVPACKYPGYDKPRSFGRIHRSTHISEGVQVKTFPGFCRFTIASNGASCPITAGNPTSSDYNHNLRHFGYASRVSAPFRKLVHRVTILGCSSRDYRTLVRLHRLVYQNPGEAKDKILRVMSGLGSLGPKRYRF
jgi:hypothetical protein